MGSLSKGCVAALIYPAQVLRLFIYSLLLEIEFCSKKKKKKGLQKTGLITYPCLLCLADFPFGCAEPHKGKKGALCALPGSGAPCKTGAAPTLPAQPLLHVQ